MNDDYSRLMREIQRLELELEAPIDRKRRSDIKDAIHHMKQKLVDLQRVRA